MPTEGLIWIGIEDDGGPPPTPRPAAPPAAQPQAAGVSEMPDWCPRYRELQNRSDLLREEGKTLAEAERTELARLRGRLDSLTIFRDAAGACLEFLKEARLVPRTASGPPAAGPVEGARRGRKES